MASNLNIFFLADHTFLSVSFSLTPPAPSLPHAHISMPHTHTQTERQKQHSHTRPERISSAFKLSSRFLCLPLSLPLFQWGAAATRVGVGRVPTLISTGVLLGALSPSPPPLCPRRCFVCLSLSLTYSCSFPGFTISPPRVLKFTKNPCCPPALIFVLYSSMFLLSASSVLSPSLCLSLSLSLLYWHEC